MTFKLRRIALILFSAAILILAGTAASADTGVRLLGDADQDGVVTIIDATCIQRFLAGLPVNGGIDETAADTDGSGKIEITDATYIQRWLADLETSYPIGSELTAPTDSPTELPTQRPTDEEGWERDIFRP